MHVIVSVVMISTIVMRYGWKLATLSAKMKYIAVEAQKFILFILVGKRFSQIIRLVTLVTFRYKFNKCNTLFSAKFWFILNTIATIGRAPLPTYQGCSKVLEVPDLPKLRGNMSIGKCLRHCEDSAYALLYVILVM